MPSSWEVDASSNPDSQTHRSHHSIYLDNAATSFPKPEPVYQALDRFARTQLANPGRSGHRMAMEAERTLDDARHALNQFFHGESPERWIFTLNCTDGLNMAIKGAVQPGDHVITTDLEHNSISRPLRRLEKAGVITLDAGRLGRGLSRPGATSARRSRRRPGSSRSRTPRTCWAPCSRSRRSPRSSARPAPCSWSTPRSRPGVVPIDLRRRRSTCSPSPATRPSTARPAPASSTSARGPRPRAWREGGTGGDSKSETQPDLMPYFLEGGTPNVLGVAGLAAGIAWVAERGPETNRRHEVDLLQRVVDWVEGQPTAGKIAGRWDPATHVGALSLIVPDPTCFTPRTSARSSTPASRSPSAPACTAPVHPPAARHLPRRHPPPQPRPVQHGRAIDAFLNALTEITAGVL